MTALYRTALYRTALYMTALHMTALYMTALYLTALFMNALPVYMTALYRIALVIRCTHGHSARYRYGDEAGTLTGAQGEAGDFSGVRFKVYCHVRLGVVQGLVQRELRAKVVELLRLEHTLAARNTWRLV